MYSLFIDTHDEEVKIIIFKDGTILDKKILKSSMNHSVMTMPIIDEILKSNNLKPSDIQEILVVNGPGSFTGVRIGVTIAKTFAYLLNIPIKAIDVLEMKSIFSDESKKIVVESEKNGKYIGIFNDNSKEYLYLKNSEFEKFEENNKITIIDDIDYEKVYEYLKNKENINPHAVNPLYIKKIEVEK